jgi:hypothetical protein
MYLPHKYQYHALLVLSICPSLMLFRVRIRHEWCHLSTHRVCVCVCVRVCVCCMCVCELQPYVRVPEHQQRLHRQVVREGRQHPRRGVQHGLPHVVLLQEPRQGRVVESRVVLSPSSLLQGIDGCMEVDLIVGGWIPAGMKRAGGRTGTAPKPAHSPATAFTHRSSGARVLTHLSSSAMQRSRNWRQ